jgi:hypothetical protein
MHDNGVYGRWRLHYDSLAGRGVDDDGILARRRRMHDNSFSAGRGRLHHDSLGGRRLDDNGLLLCLARRDVDDAFLNLAGRGVDDHCRRSLHHNRRRRMNNHSGRRRNDNGRGPMHDHWRRSINNHPGRANNRWRHYDSRGKNYRRAMHNHPWRPGKMHDATTVAMVDDASCASERESSRATQGNPSSSSHTFHSFDITLQPSGYQIMDTCVSFGDTTAACNRPTG